MLGGKLYYSLGWGMGVFVGGEGSLENVTVEKKSEGTEDLIIQRLGEDHFRQEKKKIKFLRA